MAALPFPGLRASPWLRVGVILAVLIVLVTPLATHPTPGPLAGVLPSLPAFPMAFVRDHAAADPQVRFRAIGLGGAIAFTPSAVELTLPGAALQPSLRLEFVAANPAATITGADPTGGQLNLVQGADPAQWRTGLPLYSALDYSGLYAGIDLRYEGGAGQLKGTFYVAPGADPASIRWRYPGAARLALDQVSGDLLLALPNGATLTERAPVAWQERAGQRQPVAARFALRGGEVSFRLGAYDQALPLVIDPTLVWGTFAGGASGDYARGLAVDAQGNIYLVGDTLSSNFLGLSYTAKGSNDLVVLKLNPAATSLIYAAIVGGSDTDTGAAIGVNAAGEAYVSAHAPSSNFPVSNALYPAKISGNSGVLLKFAANGALAFSTWLPLNFNANARQVLALDSQGSVLITGEHYDSTDFRSDLAVLKLNGAGTSLAWGLVWSDDRVHDAGTAVAIGPGDSIHVAGFSDGPFDDFKVTGNALQPLCGRQTALGTGMNCDQDALVVILEADGTEQYVSYWGGEGDDHATGIAVAPDGSFVVTGDTFAADFPTTAGTLMPDCVISTSSGACYYDSFVTKFTPQAAAVAWSTYLASNGAEDMDYSSGVAIDADGNIAVAGYTSGTAFPTMNPVQGALKMGGFCSGAFTRFCFDAYATVFAPDGALSFSTYLGGEWDEYTGGLVVDGRGDLYLAGYSDSKLNFPTTTGVLQPAARLGNEMFIAKISLAQGGSNPPPSQPHRLFLPALLR